MEYAIEQYEPNPHQSKEALTKNRTFHAKRWKEVYRLQNYTEQEAINVFNAIGKGYRLLCRDNGEVVRSNVKLTEL